ncbi:MAG TPA: N-acetyltransferase [Gammaproteobacteria bacterium]
MSAAGEAPSASPLTVRAVAEAEERRAFIDLPWALYRDDPVWIPPLRAERRLHLSRHNPFFEHGTAESWVAWRGDRPVGRLTAQVDRLHRLHHGPDTGQFGFLEAENDAAVFAALLGAAEQWLAARGALRITGPFNYSINQECGVLVDGFADPPSVMMPHGRPWYGARLEEQGYRRATDMLAYWVEVRFRAPEAMQRLVRRYATRVTLRRLDRLHFSRDLEILRDIFNDAWSGNWGFVPLTEAEMSDMGNSLKLFVPDGYVQIADVDGAPAAFLVLLPNLNEILSGLDGRLLPFGWLKLLWRMRRHHYLTGRVALMGVRKPFQSTPLGIALAYQVIDAARTVAVEHDMRGVEMSWILEDNKGMRSILDSIGSRLYKRYRVYEKSLGTA